MNTLKIIFFVWAVFISSTIADRKVIVIINYCNFNVDLIYYNKLLTLITIKPHFSCNQLYAEFNPGCLSNDSCSQISKLAYVRAEGDNDTVHFVFDFFLKPSLVVLKTNKDATIKVNYQNNTIKFTKTPLYTFASVFNNVSKLIFITYIKSIYVK